MVSLMLLMIIESLIELSNLLQICQCLSLFVFWVFFKPNKLSIDWIDFYDILSKTLLSISNYLCVHSSYHITTMLIRVSLLNQPAIDNSMELLGITRQLF